MKRKTTNATMWQNHTDLLLDCKRSIGLDSVDFVLPQTRLFQTWDRVALKFALHLLNNHQPLDKVIVVIDKDGDIFGFISVDADGLPSVACCDVKDLILDVLRHKK